MRGNDPYKPPKSQLQRMEPKKNIDPETDWDSVVFVCTVGVISFLLALTLYWTLNHVYI